VTVSGSGSTWKDTGNLTIGDLGTGTLAVTGGGLVSVTGTTSLGSAGTLQLDDLSTFNTGALTSAGGTVSTIGDVTFSPGATLGSGGMTVDTGGVNTVFSGVLSGTGGLVKSGSGTLTLTGASTYTGTTLVSAGTLALKTNSIHTASLGNTAITVASGATFMPVLSASPSSTVINVGTTASGSPAASLTLDPGSIFSMAGLSLATFNLLQWIPTSGAFTIGGASGIAPKLIFNIGNAAAGTDLINVTGFVDIQSTGGEIVIDPLAGDTSLTPGNYDLINASNIGPGDEGNNGLFLSGTTVAVGGVTYDLSLSQPNAGSEVLNVSASTPSTPADHLAATPALSTDGAAAPLISTAAVPEPGATASLFFAFAVIAVSLLRRRKSAQAPDLVIGAPGAASGRSVCASAPRRERHLIPSNIGIRDNRAFGSLRHCLGPRACFGASYMEMLTGLDLEDVDGVGGESAGEGGSQAGRFRGDGDQFGGFGNRVGIRGAICGEDDGEALG
jgi:autotransporter-associated beta strand protein/T5SS/PEP-CTERM-associated repeat protein